MFHTFVHVLVQCFLELHAHVLCKFCTFALPFVRLGPNYTPMTFDQSAVFIKTMTVANVVAFEWPSMLLEENTMFFGPVNPLRFPWNAGIAINSILHFPSAPFILVGFWAL